MAAVDFFLKIDGIPGEATADGHTGEIEIDSYKVEWTNEAHSSGGGSGAGKVVPSDVLCKGPVSKASPLLFLACCNGTHLKSALISCRKAGGTQQDYLQIELTDVLVTHYSHEPAEEGVVPEDDFSLNFSKIKFTYKIQKPDGSTAPGSEAGWDNKVSKKL